MCHWPYIREKIGGNIVIKCERKKERVRGGGMVVARGWI